MEMKGMISRRRDGEGPGGREKVERRVIENETL